MKNVLFSCFILLFLAKWSSLHAQKPVNKEISPTIRVGFSGYFGYRLGKAAPGVDEEYVKEIRPGGDLNVDASYYVKPSLALGLKYCGFWSAGATHTGSPNMISNIKISYFGPILYANVPLHSKRSLFSYGVSLGYVGYTDNGWIDFEKTFIKSNTVGALIELCYDLKIYKSLYIGINTGLSGGVLSKANINGREVTLNKDQKESLSKVFAGIGLRFIR